MRKRKVNHRKEEARAYEPIPSSEYREILDLYLTGSTFIEIAKSKERELEAIRLLISSKIPMNYDEGGKRKPAIERLNEKKSSLIPERLQTRRDIEYFKKLKRRGRTIEECSQIMNIMIDALWELEKQYGLPQKKGGFW